MANNNAARNWFSKTFGRSAPPDPAKQRYETRLRNETPDIQLAAQVSPEYKKAMATGLKEAQTLAKSKKYDEAAERLRALGVTAREAQAPKLSGAVNAPQLLVASQRLQRAMSEAVKEKVTLVRPSLAEEEKKILDLIEAQDDANAILALNALDTRIADIVRDRPIALQESSRVRQESRAHGVPLPKQLAGELDGMSGMANLGDLAGVRWVAGRADLFNQRALKLVQDRDLLLRQAKQRPLGTDADIDKAAKPMNDALALGDLDRADVRLKSLADWATKEGARVDAIEEGVADVRDSVETHQLSIIPPATLDGGEKKVLDLLALGDLHKAELALKDHRAALGSAAEVLRLKQVLQRLIYEEEGAKRFEPKWFDTQTDAVRQLLLALKPKEAQVALKKIQDAIAEHHNKLGPEGREAAGNKEAERRHKNRIERAKAQALGSTDQKLLDAVGRLEKITPPLDRNKQAMAAELYTLVTLLGGQGKLEGKSGSANGVFTLKTSDRLEKSTKYKQFFKPVSGEKALPGFPSGGGASREVVGKAVADKLAAMTGLPIHVAETHLIELPPEVLPPDLAKKGKAIGSLQHNVHHKGDAEQRPLDSMDDEEKKALFAKIPKKEAQAKQVYDLVFLNLDVHQGNIFVKGEGESAQLDGIDNGMGLPSKAGLLNRSEAFGTHALAGFPANKDKFDPEILKAIDQMDDKAIGQAAKESFAAMKKDFPDSEATSDDKLNDEHIGVMQASVRFLKAAAKELTVEELQSAYLVNMQDIFAIGPGSDTSEKERFDEAIKQAKSRGAALLELRANEAEVMRVANTAKWLVPPIYQRGPIIQQTLLKFYPVQFVKIWKAGGTPVGPLTGDPPKPPVVPLDQCPKTEIEAYTKANGGKVPTDNDTTAMAHWRAYEALGGDSATQRLGGALSASPMYGIADQRYKLLWQLTEVKKAMAGV